MLKNKELSLADDESAGEEEEDRLLAYSKQRARPRPKVTVSSSGSDDSSGVDVADFLDDEAEEGEEEDGELSEVVGSDDEEEEEEGGDWVLQEAVESNRKRDTDVLDGSGDEEVQSNNDQDEAEGEDVQTGDEGEDVQTGDEGEDVQTGDEGEDVQTGDEGEDVQTGDEGEDVQTGDEGEDVQTGDEGEDVQTGDEDEDVQTGDEDEDVQTGDEDEDVQTGDEDKDVQTGDEDEDMQVGERGLLKWKEGLEQKARKSFELRKSDSVMLRRLIYDEQAPEQGEEGDEGTPNEFGGLFTTARKKQKAVILHEDDCSLTNTLVVRDWTDASAAAAIKRLFVTGEWEEGDAQRLLAEDEGDGEEDGDFEDLETGEKHASEQERLEKKKELKTHFDTEYDDGEGTSYLDELKQAVSEQAELNRKEFEDLNEESRAAYAGLRPGLYVRMEIKGERVRGGMWEENCMWSHYCIQTLITTSSLPTKWPHHCMETYNSTPFFFF